MIEFLGQVIFITIPICIPILDYLKVNRLNLDLLKFAIFIHSKQTTLEQSFGILQEVKFHIWVFWDKIFTAVLGGIFQSAFSGMGFSLQFPGKIL